MSKFKKTAAVFLALCCSGILSACEKKINSSADEVRMYDWCFSGEYGLEAKLCFYEENAALTVESHDESCTIDGLCLIDDNTIVIIDNTLHSEYVFEYTVSGRTLTLLLNGEKAEFEKMPEN